MEEHRSSPARGGRPRAGRGGVQGGEGHGGLAGSREERATVTSAAAVVAGGVGGRLG